MTFGIYWNNNFYGIGKKEETAKPEAQETAAPVQEKEVTENAKQYIGGNAEESEKRISSDDLEELVKVLSTITPVGSRRETVPNSMTLADSLKGLLLAKPGYELELLDIMDNLAIYHPDISKALDNLFLANTDFTVYFDEKATDKDKKEMLKFINKHAETWYEYSDGTNSLINDFIMQLGLYGCISFEMVANSNLDNLASIVRVHPRNIRFHYDVDKSKYIPIQKIPNSILPGFKGSTILGSYKRLDNTGYRYIGMHRVGESPYAIPPFIAALESLIIQKDMMDNLKKVIEKLGLMGFLTVLLNTPQKTQGETQPAYEQRLRDTIAENIPEIQKGMKSGFLVSFNDGPGASKDKKIEMNTVTQNVAGAEKMVQINDTRLIAGLKDTPALMGRDFTTTETFGRVLLAIMTTKHTNYQRNIATALKQIFSMALFLAGFKNWEVQEVEFDKVMLGDEERAENAYAKRVETAIKLRNENIIDQTQVAHTAGYDEPAGDAPVQPDPTQDPNGNNPADANKIKPNNPTAQPDATKSKQKAANHKVKLPDNIVQQLKKQPDDGSGYQWVNIETEDCTYNDILVNGHTEALMPVAIETKDITGFTVSKKKIQAAIVKLGGHLQEYDYGSCGSECEHDHGYLSLAADPGDPLHNSYLSSANKKFKKAVDDVTKRVAEGLQSIETGASAEQVLNRILLDIYSQWDLSFLRKIQPVIKKNVEELYRIYRSDKSPFTGKSGIPNATFDVLDVRVMEFFTIGDALYLGKFITDQDTKARISRWVYDNYINDSLPIGRNSPGINLFKEEFKGVLDAESWKIRRVIDTTVNRLRNTGAINYMQQAEITEFKVQGVSDRLQCPYCAAMQGKTMRVEISYQKVKELVYSDPASLPTLNPFLTSGDNSPEELKKMDGRTIQDLGYGNPPFHPHCRDTVVIA